jgi:hypothetical protein
LPDAGAGFSEQAILLFLSFCCVTLKKAQAYGDNGVARANELRTVLAALIKKRPSDSRHSKNALLVLYFN